MGNLAQSNSKPRIKLKRLFPEKPVIYIFSDWLKTCKSNILSANPVMGWIELPSTSGEKNS